MAKATAICKCSVCGSEFTKISYKNNRREADSWEAWAADNYTICPDCEAKAREAAVEAQKEADAAEGLPELTGSEKQVRWAVQLRAEMITKLNDHLAKVQGNVAHAAERLAKGKSVKHTPEEWEERYKEEEVVVSYIQRQADASWWIDNGDERVMDLLNDNKEDALAAAAEEVEEEAAEEEPEEVADDAVMIPEDATEGTVEITVTEGAVEARYPKDDTFRGIVKEAGYKWDGHCWSKQITERTGSAVDRAAELANRLLRAGFSVRCENAAVREMAVSASFEPEYKNWIAYYSAGEYAGWLAVSVPGRGEDDQGLYDAAKKIRGSRYNRGAVAVPMSHYAEAEDFADLYGYKITRRAQDEIAKYQAQTTVKAAAPKQSVRSSRLSDILESDDSVLADLEDD